MQKVVRTYPNGYLNATKELSILLAVGYEVIMCHEVNCGKEKCLEYIVERDDEK